MSWLRRPVLLFLLLALASCGFEPIYGTSSEGDGEVVPYAIRITPIGGGRPGQELTVQLENLLDPLHQRKPAEYRLDVGLKEALTPLVIERDRRISRYNLSYTADYRLFEVATGQEVYRGTSRITGSYDRVASDYATYAAQADTATRVMREMAKDIKVQVLAYLAETVKGAPVR